MYQQILDVDFQITQAGGNAKLFGEEVKALLHDLRDLLPARASSHH